MTQTVRSERGRVGYKYFITRYISKLSENDADDKNNSEINTNTKKRTGTKQLLTYVIEVEFPPRY